MKISVTRLLPLTLCLIGASTGTAQNYFEGFVTNIISPKEFDVGERHVQCDAKTKWDRPSHLPDPLAALRVGMLLRVDGGYRNGAYFARTIHIAPHKVKIEADLAGRALIQQPPMLKDTELGLAGTLWVDGYPLQVVPHTVLLSVDGGAVRLEKITTNVWADYEARRGDDGLIFATKITFEPNHIDGDEKDLRDKSEPEIIPADPVHHKAGQLKFGAHIPVKWDLIPDQDVQDYVTKVGMSLVPQYQKDLPATDPTKINFRFYAVKVPSGWIGNMEDSFDQPNGIVLVPDTVLGTLENEAQFASWLAMSIANIIEKNYYQHHNRLHGVKYAKLIGSGLSFVPAIPRTGMLAGVIYDKLPYELFERSSRIALTYLLAQGYDIRQVPFTPRIVAGLEVTNPVAPDTEVPPDVADTMEELQLDYANTNYAGLKQNREAFAIIKGKVAAVHQ